MKRFRSELWRYLQRSVPAGRPPWWNPPSGRGSPRWRRGRRGWERAAPSAGWSDRYEWRSLSRWTESPPDRSGRTAADRQTDRRVNTEQNLTVTCVCVCVYQDAVEQLVDEQSQRGREDVRQVVQELHIHHHGFVSHNKRPVVPHEAHHKHHLVEQLVNRKHSRFRPTGEEQVRSLITAAEQSSVDQINISSVSKKLLLSVHPVKLEL